MINPYSKISLWFCFVLMIWTGFFFYPRWNQSKTESTISWDVSGYYMYLPAIVIYHDLKEFGFLDSMIQKYGPTPDPQQIHVTQEGKKVFKYSGGQALMMAPFFFIAHGYALLSGQYPADGFSFPYQLGIGLGMWIYAFIGLWLLRRFLLYTFSDLVTGIVLLLLVFGSNFLNYSSIDQAMTHQVLFTIYVGILLLSRKYHEESPNAKYLGWIGVLCGIAVWIRPTEIIALLIPLAWHIRNISTCRQQMQAWLKSPQKLLILFLPVCLFFFIQMLYWKIYSGHWLMYSYGNQGFSWLSPHIRDFLINFRSGWLLYCPLMILALPAVFIMLFRTKNGLVFFIFIALAFYITTAWDVWDYGGGSGRAMVQYYPAISIALASLIQFVLRKKLALLLILFCVPAVYINLWWTYQAHAGTIQVSQASKQYYLKTIGRWSIDPEYNKLLDNNYIHEKSITVESLIYINTLDSDTANYIVQEAGNPCIRLDAYHDKTKEYPCSTWTNRPRIIRASALFWCQEKEWDVWKQTQFIVRFFRKNIEIQSHMIRIFRFLNAGEKKRIWLDAQCPEAFDVISISFWNANSPNQIWIDDLKILKIE